MIQEMPLGRYSRSYRSINLRASSRSFATGFSLTTFLPACHACSITAGWTRIGRERITVAMSDRASNAARSSWLSDEYAAGAHAAKDGCSSAAARRDAAEVDERE